MYLLFYYIDRFLKWVCQTPGTWTDYTLQVSNYDEFGNVVETIWKFILWKQLRLSKMMSSREVDLFVNL